MDSKTTGSVSLRPHEYLVSLDGKQFRVYCPAGGPIEVDGHVIEARLDGSGEGVSIVEYHGRRHRILFESHDGTNGEFALSVNGRRAVGVILDRRLLLRQRMRGAEASESASTTVKAPMPGLVLKVLVRAGQEVAKGDGLLVLEAMKMENEVKADRPGRIETVAVTERTPVEKGQPLLTIHPIA